MMATRTAQCQPVHFLRAEDEVGVACYFVIRASASAIARLGAQRHKPGTDLTAYGEILESGYGSTPPSNVRARLKAQYGLTITG